MTNNKLKKLSLKRETIRTLSGGQLDAVVGGTIIDPFTTSSGVSASSGSGLSTHASIGHLSGIKDQ